MIVVAPWLYSTTGEPVRFDDPESAWNFLGRVNYNAPCLHNRTITDWYPDDAYTGGFRWTWGGESPNEKALFFALFAKWDDA